MKSIRLLIATTLCIISVGCASFSTRVFNATKTAVDVTYSSVHAFNEYYKVVSTNITTAQLQELNAKRSRIYDESRKIGFTAETTEALRLEYDRLQQDTNKTALLISLEALNSQSSNIVSLVRMFITK